MPEKALTLITPKENAPVAHAVVNDRSGFWVSIIALVLAAFSAGIAIMQPSITEAKIDAGKAELRAEFAQQIADVQALANTSNQHARVALDKVEQTQVQLGAKGFIVPSTH